MLKLRTIGINDYSVLEGRQRIGRIRFADERLPPAWRFADGIGRGPRPGDGGIQSGLGKAQGQDAARASLRRRTGP
jgi:hypothetical protein